MRTNIDIDDALMSEAMKAGPFQTKKEAVEAGLKLLARQVAYREILKWRGKLKWEGDESIDWTRPETPVVSEALPAAWPKPKRAGREPAPAAEPAAPRKRRAGR
ncbi:MAG TPA: type II toxin-antitoxin system VapB family antitoxin [Burkholderiaceae bacterium]|nr:type II toxin-antitoxin system VapB family antitoxin [Burkholderiaceae bacterium]